MLAQGYAVGILLGLVYLLEALGHLCSLQQWWFIWDTICFLHFHRGNYFLLENLLSLKYAIVDEYNQFDDNVKPRKNLGIALKNPLSQVNQPLLYVFVKHHYSSNNFFVKTTCKQIVFTPPVQRDAWRNGYKCWFPRFLRRQSSEGCKFNPECRLETIQECLTLVPSYGKQNQNRWPPWIQ